MIRSHKRRSTRIHMDAVGTAALLVARGLTVAPPFSNRSRIFKAEQRCLNTPAKIISAPGIRAVGIRRAQNSACGIHKGENAESTDSETNQDTHKADVQETVENDGADERKENTRHEPARGREMPGAWSSHIALFRRKRIL